MSHVHDSGTTVVEDRSGTSLLAVVLIVGLVALLAWFLFFSGVVMDRGSDTADTDRTEIREETTNEGDTNIINPPQDTSGGTSGDTSQPTTAP